MPPPLPSVPVEDSDPSPALHLESPDLPSGQARIVALCKLSLSTVKRMARLGRATGDPPPFDLPAQLPEWWERMRTAGHLTQKCGTRFDAAIAAGRAKAAPALPPAAAVTSPAIPTPVPPAAAPPQAPPRISLRAGAPDELPSDLLTVLQQDMARHHRRYQDAIDQNADDDTIRRYRASWLEAAKELDLHKNRLSRRGEVLDPDEVDTAFRRLMQKLPEALDRALGPEQPPGSTWLEIKQRAIREAWSHLPETLEQLLAA